MRRRRCRHLGCPRGRLEEGQKAAANRHQKENRGLRQKIQKGRFLVNVSRIETVIAIFYSHPSRLWICSRHYSGKLEDGSEFDSSYGRNQPFVFTLGVGQVIKGWDQGNHSNRRSQLSIILKTLTSILVHLKGLLDMCEGEKRKLVIPSHLGYGDNGAPPKIPGGATLIFEVELLKIERKGEL